MIDTVVSVKLPIGEMLRIKRNRLMPDVVTGEEKRICLVSGIYGDELGGQYICGEIIRRIKAEFENLTGIVGQSIRTGCTNKSSTNLRYRLQQCISRRHQWRSGRLYSS